AVEVPDQPGHSVGLHGGQQRIKLARGQTAHLFKRTGREHRSETCLDPANQFLALAGYENLACTLSIDKRGQPFPMPVRERTPRRQHHFQRTRNPRPIVHHHTLRGRGIELSELSVQSGSTFKFQPVPYLIANFRGDWRHRGKARRQCLKIQSSASNDHRDLFPGDCLADRVLDIAAPSAHRIIFPRVNKPEEAMRQASLVVGCRSRRNDAQVTVYLHRVSVDDCAAQIRRDVERERRLAACGRPCNKHGSAGTMHRMNHVATLIDASGVLEPSVLGHARSLLANTGAPQMLGPDAADIPFNAENAFDKDALDQRLRGIASGIDVVVQPLSGRRKKLFLADMDSTMIGQECIDELAEFVGLKAHVAAITERAMRGDIAFEPALRERVALLKGVPISVIEDLLRDRISLTPGARTLVATMRANGAYT